MRRISLALALIGAVAATGCGAGAKSSGTGAAPGSKEGSFTVTVARPNAGTPSAITITSGTLDSSGTFKADTGKIACTVDASSKCTDTFPLNTAVVLQVTPAGSTDNYFLQNWAGDCQGEGLCKLSGNADKYVVAVIVNERSGHPNYSNPAAHDAAVAAFAKGGDPTMKCTNCHGEKLTGVGLAVACTSCHTTTAQINGILAIMNGTTKAVAGKENCSVCHATDGVEKHQKVYNEWANGLASASKLKASNLTLSTKAETDGTYTATVKVTLTLDGKAYTSTLKQKTMYFVSYDATTKTFPTAPYKCTADIDPTGTLAADTKTDTCKNDVSSVNFSFGTPTLTNSTTGEWTFTAKGLPKNPTSATDFPNSFIYGYFGDKNLTIPANTNTARHYALMDNMVSVAQVVNGTIDYTSSANVSGCEKCHGAPYSKHGYRQADVFAADGTTKLLNTFVACKACHTDQRRGTDAAWYLLVEDLPYAASGLPLTPELLLKYAYTANVMQDTHNSHAMEFAYPQSVANCVACHEGKLTTILADKNFNGLVCKSCHATTATEDIEGRAPSFNGPKLKAKLEKHNFNWVAQYDAAHALVAPAGTIKETDGSYVACTECHADDIADGYTPGAKIAAGDPKATDGVGPLLFGRTTPVPLFKDIHSGRNARIYGADGSKYLNTIKSTVDSVAFDATTNKATIKFSISGMDANAIAKPTVVASLYGYDTKDFYISGHSSQFSDKTPNLEWSEGAVIRGTTTPANTSRLTVSPATATAGTTQWTVTVDLTIWKQLITNGVVNKIEVAFLPTIGLDQTKAPDKAETVTTAGVTSPNPNYNPYIAAGGTTVTVDVTATSTSAAVADKYGKGIVAADNCNKCHDALATTFHDPNYGSAGVIGCRLCHFVGTGGSHLEMQSRSIDAYVHAIHSYQPFDIGTIDFADPVAAFEVEEHIASEYPNFTTFNCESCHDSSTAVTYNVPALDKSLPSISSASATLKNRVRAISGVPSVVTGASSRACGSCHRSMMINEDDAVKLGWFDQHTGASYGVRETYTAGSGTWGDATYKKSTFEKWVETLWPTLSK